MLVERLGIARHMPEARGLRQTAEASAERRAPPVAKRRSAHRRRKQAREPMPPAKEIVRQTEERPARPRITPGIRPTTYAE